MVLPLPLDEAQLESGQNSFEIPQDLISPWCYHTILSETGLVYHRLIHAVRKTTRSWSTREKSWRSTCKYNWSPSAHLQPYGDESPELKYLPEQHPWIKWQRVDLITALFLWRSSINYECHQECLISPPNSLARRMFCLKSPQSVILLLESADMLYKIFWFSRRLLRIYANEYKVGSKSWHSHWFYHLHLWGYYQDLS